MIEKRIYTYIVIYRVRMKQLIIEMDEKTKKHFKQVTLENDTSMAIVVRSCIDRYLAEKTKSVVY